MTWKIQRKLLHHIKEQFIIRPSFVKWKFLSDQTCNLQLCSSPMYRDTCLKRIGKYDQHKEILALDYIVYSFDIEYQIKSTFISSMYIIAQFSSRLIFDNKLLIRIPSCCKIIATLIILLANFFLLDFLNVCYLLF